MKALRMVTRAFSTGETVGLHKTISKHWMKKEIEKANVMVESLMREDVVIDDLALTYLIEGNLEEEKQKEAFDYVIYAHLTDQVLDIEIYRYLLEKSQGLDVSYLSLLYSLLHKDFIIPHSLFLQFYQGAYHSQETDLLSILDAQIETQGMEIDFASILAKDKKAVKKGK